MRAFRLCGLLLALLPAGCALPKWQNPGSRPWHNKAAIEQRMRDHVPVGSSRAAVRAFIDREKLKFIEAAQVEIRPPTIAVYFLTRRGIPGMIAWTVFHFDAQDNVERIEVSETSREFL